MSQPDLQYIHLSIETSPESIFGYRFQVAAIFSILVWCIVSLRNMPSKNAAILKYGYF
jgi:hypothetical protein